jgi:(2Fe-2S) ferredoxin
MYWKKRHLLVCTAVHCQQKGAMDVAGLLRLQVIRQQLDAEVLVNNCGTIDLCDIGPNIVVYPDNIIYSGVQKDDIKDIIAFLKGGPVVERLLLNRDTPAEARRREFYRAAVADGGALSAEAFTALAQDHGYNEGWIAEQQRRGFIAQKTDADESRIITVTKKARERYGV